MTTYRSLNHTENGTVSITLCSSRSIEERRCTGDCGGIWARCPPSGAASRERGGGGASVAGPCAYDDVDSAEVLCRPGHRISQGEECHPHRSGVRGTFAELRGAALLGRGYFVSTVGRDERVIREYIQQQEREDRRSDQLPLE